MGSLLSNGSQSDASRKSGAIHYAVTALEKAETQLWDLA